jgi:hypothetical protein
MAPYVLEVESLEQIRKRGKTSTKATAVAIAHGLAFDPHVDGRLRLTSKGHELVGRVNRRFGQESLL